MRFNRLSVCFHYSICILMLRYLLGVLLPLMWTICMILKRKKMKYMLSKVPSRISLTYDVWTSCTSKGYVSLTVHYLDANWKLNSKMLNFSHFPPPHLRREMAKVIYGFFFYVSPFLSFHIFFFSFKKISYLLFFSY